MKKLIVRIISIVFWVVIIGFSISAFADEVTDASENTSSSASLNNSEATYETVDTPDIYASRTQFYKELVSERNMRNQDNNPPSKISKFFFTIVFLLFLCCVVLFNWCIDESAGYHKHL